MSHEATGQHGVVAGSGGVEDDVGMPPGFGVMTSGEVTGGGQDVRFQHHSGKSRLFQEMSSVPGAVVKEQRRLQDAILNGM